MNKRFAAITLAALFTALAACSRDAGPQPGAVQAPGPSPAIIPVPREFFGGNGWFAVNAATRVHYSGGAGAAEAASYFIEQARHNPEIVLAAASEGAAVSKGISFEITAADQSLADEGYALAVTPDGARVTARTPTGLFYGAVTLWQLLTVFPPQSGVAQIRAMQINDAPRFRWRGLMLDSARHYQSPEYIRNFIDWMGQHKLNVLHWHLTDDQAWRLEIKKYPRLTSVGAWRVPAGQAPREDIDPKTGKPRLYGGFYTQDQARDIVAYAATRHIKVVPEIEMPGHATAAIVAYPELGVAPFADKLKAVPEEWGVFENLFNVEESTFGFLEDVMSEVMTIFPSEYIHVGGDEAVKPQWEKSARVKARMKEFGVKDAHALQSYFIQRMGKYLNKNGGA